MNLLLVAIGGFFGSITRFYIYEKANRHIIGTWIANITGSIFLAFIFHFYFSQMISDQLWLFFGVGFCGAYTTFSTFGNETLQFCLEERYFTAAAYVFCSLVISLLFIVIFIN